MSALFLLMPLLLVAISAAFFAIASFIALPWVASTASFQVASEHKNLVDVPACGAGTVPAVPVAVAVAPVICFVPC